MQAQLSPHGVRRYTANISTPVGFFRPFPFSADAELPGSALRAAEPALSNYVELASDVQN